MLLGRLGKNLYSQLKVAKKNFHVCLCVSNHGIHLLDIETEI